MDSRLRENDGVGAAGDAPPWVVEFLATLIVSGSVDKALAAAGIDLETAAELAVRQPDFAIYWDRAVRVHRSGALAALAAGAPAGASFQ